MIVMISREAVPRIAFSSSRSHFNTSFPSRYT